MIRLCLTVVLGLGREKVEYHDKGFSWNGVTGVQTSHIIVFPVVLAITVYTNVETWQRGNVAIRLFFLKVPAIAGGKRKSLETVVDNCATLCAWFILI